MTRTRLDLAVSAVVTLAVLGPLLTGAGYWLFGDMVFVPEQPWKDAWLGLDGSLPRAVPMDAIVSVLTHVVPGEVVQKAFLTAAFVLGGLGVGRLVGRLVGPGVHAVGRVAAIVFFLWNPWVHEHLLLGQWAILAGYLALPWVAIAARRLRHDLRTGWAPAAVALVVSAVCSPSSGVMAVGVLVVLGTRWRDWRSWIVIGALGLGANLTWLVPTLTASTATISTAGVFDLFAARAESSVGLYLSVTSLGGTWKTSIVAPERTEPIVVMLSALLSIAAFVGLRRATDREDLRRLVALATIAVLIALTPPSALEAVADRVPAAALLRDTHRFLAPLALTLAVGLAGAATWAREQVRPGREAMWAVAGLAVVAPVVLLPSLAWGGGELERSTYPAEWDAVADRVGADDTTVVLPWDGSYRRFAFTHDRAWLDPAPRLLPGEVLVDDRTLVDGEVVPSEDPRVGAVTTALSAGDPDDVSSALRDLGVRWVLLEPGAPSDVAAGTTVVDEGELRLVDLGPETGGVPSDDGTSHRSHAPLVIAGHGCGFVLLVCGLLSILHSGVTSVTSVRRSPAESLGGD